MGLSTLDPRSVRVLATLSCSGDPATGISFALLRTTLERRGMSASRLGKELSLALACKIVAIVLIYAMFFSPSHRHRPTPADTAAFLTAEPAKSE